MFLGRPFIFQCDFCGQRFEKEGYGLPKGMKWLPGNYMANKGTRHICGECIEQGKHGDEKPIDSGVRA